MATDERGRTKYSSLKRVKTTGRHLIFVVIKLKCVLKAEKSTFSDLPGFLIMSVLTRL